ncbi:MAG: hypothetical protein KIS94_15675 [Chitinophagales bacterium]|nr:hypothetical protein [Chitinophagales bacterium]
MAKKKPKKKKPASEVSEENEFLKLKMMAEFGGNFVGDDNIPPEVENHFLKQIINFHKQHENSATTSIYKYIGEPEYNHVHDLNDKEVKRELKKLLRLLNRHGIMLEVLAPTPDREIYRFVTEELFKQEIGDVKMKGWTSQYVYEDFHPNAEYDLKYAAHHILLGLFDSEASLYDDYIADDLKDSLGLTTDVEELKHKVEAFRGQYHDVIMVNYDFIETNLDTDKGIARIICDVHFKTQKVKGKRTSRHLTTVEMFFRRDALVKSIWQLTRLISEYF